MTRPYTLAGAQIVRRSTALNDNPRQRERQLRAMPIAEWTPPAREPLWKSALVIPLMVVFAGCGAVLMGVM